MSGLREALEQAFRERLPDSWQESLRFDLADTALTLLPTEAETKALAETATKLGYELGRKEALADLRVMTSGVSYFALAFGPLYHTRESAAEALMKLRRTS